MGQQPGARPAPLDRLVGHGGLGDRLAAPAGELRAQVADHMEAARPILQDLGHVLAQPTRPPVKLSSRMRSSSTSRPASSLLQGRIENAPLGRSVSASTAPMISAPTGVFAAGLSTNGQPAAIAGATLCATRLSGKLNGVMNAHGPMGTRLAMPR